MADAGEGGRIDVPFLAHWRKALFLSAAELAERCGLDEGTIRRIEKGKHRANMTTLGKLASGLGITRRHLVYTDVGEGEEAAVLAENIQRRVRDDAPRAVEQSGNGA